MQTTPATATPARLSPSTLANFWLRMAGMFGHTWVSQYGANPEGIGADTWAAALSGITPHQVGHGLRAALATGADWPPSAPRFRAMCLGIPTLASVALIIRGRAEPTPFSRLVWSKLDTFRFKSSDQAKADRMLADAYDVAREFVMQGGALPAEPIGKLDKPEPKEFRQAPAEVVEAHFAKIAELLNTGAES